MHLIFVLRSLHHLSRKAEGIGPMKPWQPLPPKWKKVPNPSRYVSGEISQKFLYTATIVI